MPIVYDDIKEEVEEKVCMAVAATMSSLGWLPRKLLARVCYAVVILSMFFWSIVFSYRETYSISLWGEYKWRSFREASKSRRKEKKLLALSRLKS